MSQAAARWDWLWVLLFPTGLLLTMGVLLLHFQIYSVDRLESLALLAMLATIGAAVGVVMHRGGRVMRAIVVGILVTVFLNHVVEEFNAQGILAVSGKNFHHVTPHPDGAAGKFIIIALVLNTDQLLQNSVALDPLPFF